MREAAIAATGLVKRYRRTAVLGGIDWTLPVGGAHAWLAPAGAGKTLLLRLALGFVAQDGGELAVLGHPPRRMPGIVRRRIGYAPQRAVLRPELPIATLLAARRAGAREWDEALERRCAADFGFERAQRVGELDLAARRGFELCLALAPRPTLALLDEPCRDEGPDGRAAAILRELAARGGTTLLVTSARARDVEGIAQELTVLHLGRVLEQAPVDVLLREARAVHLPLERYARVASALAAAGIVSARTEGEEKQVVVRRFDGELAARLAAQTGGTARDRALSLDEIFAATVDVTSTGTGTRP